MERLPETLPGRLFGGYSKEGSSSCPGSPSEGKDVSSAVTSCTLYKTPPVPIELANKSHTTSGAPTDRKLIVEQFVSGLLSSFPDYRQQGGIVAVSERTRSY